KHDTSIALTVVWHRGHTFVTEADAEALPAGGGGSDGGGAVRDGWSALLRRSSRNPTRRKTAGTTTISAATTNTSGDRGAGGGGGDSRVRMNVRSTDPRKPAGLTTSTWNTRRSTATSGAVHTTEVAPRDPTGSEAVHGNHRKTRPRVPWIGRRDLQEQLRRRDRASAPGPVVRRRPECREVPGSRRSRTHANASGPQDRALRVASRAGDHEHPIGHVGAAERWTPVVLGGNAHEIARSVREGAHVPGVRSREAQQRGDRIPSHAAIRAEGQREICDGHTRPIRGRRPRDRDR